jgi:hypothetical protein
MKKSLQLVFGAVVTLLLTTGCSGLRVIDTDVTSFALWPGAVPVPGASYRFERLPSQQLLPARGLGMELPQDQLEALARAALDKVGLVNNPADAAFDVQVSASSRLIPRQAYNGRFMGGPAMAVGGGTAGSFVGFSMPIMVYEPPLYLREVSLVIRDARSHAVLYETRATHDGIWADARAVLPAMLAAALQGFPVPPSGTRRVNIEIAR